MDPLWSETLGNVAAKGTIHRLVRDRRRTECKRQLLRFRDGTQLPEDTAHQREERDLARHQHLESILVAARQTVVLGVDLRGNATVRLAANGLPHRDQVAVQRRIHRLVVILRKREVCCLRAACDDRRRNPCQGKEGTAGPWRRLH